MNEPKQPRRRRKFLRYSLRTLLIVMLVLAVPLGWHSNQARKQKGAVAWVREMGGSVIYDFEYDHGDYRIFFPDPPAPQWAIKLFGIDFVDDVAKVDLAGKDVTDVFRLAELSSIRSLDLSSTQVEDIAPLKGLGNLKRLNLHETPVPVDDIKELRKLLKKCRIYWLYNP